MPSSHRGWRASTARWSSATSRTRTPSAACEDIELVVHLAVLPLNLANADPARRSTPTCAARSTCSTPPAKRASPALSTRRPPRPTDRPTPIRSSRISRCAPTRSTRRARLRPRCSCAVWQGLRLQLHHPALHERLRPGPDAGVVPAVTRSLLAASAPSSPATGARRSTSSTSRTALRRTCCRSPQTHRRRAQRRLWRGDLAERAGRHSKRPAGPRSQARVRRPGVDCAAPGRLDRARAQLVGYRPRVSLRDGLADVLEAQRGRPGANVRHSRRAAPRRRGRGSRGAPAGRPQHRPPRARRRGLSLDGPVGLAHRRLSIIDLSPSGHQPMSNEDGSVWLTYNGEIYNFRELRRLLEARGHRFVSHTDTEVLVHGYEEWGEACSSASTASSRSRSGTAAGAAAARPRPLRHQAAVSPSGPRGLLFGSEIKAILALAGEPARLSLRSLVQYMSFPEHVRRGDAVRGRHHPAPRDLDARRRGRNHHAGRVLRPAPVFGADAGKGHADALGAALQRAVDRQLMSDVPVGAYLSGGMDSASLVVLAGRRIPHIHTFTAGFDVSRRFAVGGRRRRTPRRRSRRPRGRNRALRRGAARRGHGPCASGPRLASRGPARRHLLPELLRRPPGLQVRQGGDGRDRRRRAVRRVPVALRDAGWRRRPGWVPRRLLRLLVPAAHRRRPARRVHRQRRGAAVDGIDPRGEL